MKRFCFAFALVIALAAGGCAARKPVTAVEVPTVAGATVHAHVAHCVEGDTRLCYLSIVPTDADGKFVPGRPGLDSVYPDVEGNATFSLAPGSYRLTLYAAFTPGSLVSTVGIGVGAGATLSLDFDAAPRRRN